MPRLTPSNLIALARAARHHVYGFESPPQSVAELHERLQTRSSKLPAALYCFGLRDGPNPSPYALLFSVGLADGEDRGVASFAGQPDRVRTIEQHLAGELAKFPTPAFDLIVVLHERLDGDGWRHAAEVDADVRTCLQLERRILFQH